MHACLYYLSVILNSWSNEVGWIEKGNYSPVANPVTGFPPGAATATATAATTTEPKTPWARHIALISARWLVLQPTALEAAWAAGKVMCSAVSNCAVPVTRPNIRASKPERWTAPTKTSIISPITGSWLSAALARVPPLEVQILAWPAVPISWSAHFPFSKIPQKIK